MKVIERIVKSQGQPQDNDLWLDDSNDSLVLKAKNRGEWQTVAGGGGGGGSTEGAVSYSEAQTLTDTQKMQARANQGLYYSETTQGQTVATWDGDTTGLDYFDEREG